MVRNASRAWNGWSVCASEKMLREQDAATDEVVCVVSARGSVRCQSVRRKAAHAAHQVHLGARTFVACA